MHDITGRISHEIYLHKQYHIHELMQWRRNSSAEAME